MTCGTNEWLEDYLAPIRAERDALRAEVERLREALQATYDELQRLDCGGCECGICRQARKALALSEAGETHG